METTEQEGDTFGWIETLIEKEKTNRNMMLHRNEEMGQKSFSMPELDTWTVWGNSKRWKMDISHCMIEMDQLIIQFILAIKEINFD